MSIKGATENVDLNFRNGLSLWWMEGHLVRLKQNKKALDTFKQSIVGEKWKHKNTDLEKENSLLW